MKQNKKIITGILAILSPILLLAQGVTTGSISGTVKNEKNEILQGAVIAAQHMPSGSRYTTASQKDGNFVLQGLRIGGPYNIIVSHIGYQADTIKNANVVLGDELLVQVILRTESKELADVTVSAKRSNIMNSNKIGSGLVIDKSTLSNLPSISRGLTDFTRLVPQAGAFGILGKGGKSNSLTVDGAAFNNVFGLGNEIGGVPGVNASAQPISLDAIEQVFVNISPYDVKQGGFTGAGINAVTRSGDNEFRVSVYDFFRNQNLVGNKIKDALIPRTNLNENTFGFRIGGPIIKNKLFFFANYEQVKNVQPGATFLAGRPGLSGGNISNIKATDLDALAGFLKTAYSYDPGTYENYDVPIENRKFLIKLDWNINPKNKASIRYNQLNSSASFGASSNLTSIGFSNNGFSRNNDIYSITGEINSTITKKINNRFFASYTSLPDYREFFGSLFPAVTINDNGNNYIFGTNNAARSNRVDQKIFQLQNDLTFNLDKHRFSAGFNWQYLNLSNNFTFNPQGSFNFASLASFYNSAPVGTQTPVGASTGLGLPAAYSLNYTVQPQKDVTLGNPKFSQLALYLQDEIISVKNLKLTLGVRADITSFVNSPGENSTVAGLNFQNALGQTENYKTSQTPGTKVIFSPRLGFNWDVTGNRTIQLRGGTGIFAGLVPFTYIEKQYTINGLNEGSINAPTPATAANYPFRPQPAFYKPANGATLPTYEVDLVSPSFKMPKSWRNTLGVDFKIPKDWIVSVEFLYSKDIDAPFYRNVNLNYNTATTAADGRLRYTQNRINSNITGAYVLDNVDKGHQIFLTTSVNKQFSKSLSAYVAYTYGNSKDVYPLRSTTASGAFNSIQVNGNPNIPVLAYSDFDVKHRFVGSFNYKISYAKDKLASSIGIFFEGVQQGRGSYSYGGPGNLNNDQVTGNDLIFVPADQSQINLVATSTSTVVEQWAALNNFISSSSYLNSKRGQFTERAGVLFPFYFQADLKFTQDIAAKLGKNKIKNSLQFTVDILNVGNLLNKDWGVIKTLANPNPILATSPTTFTVNVANLQRGEFIQDNGLSAGINPNASSRYRVQFGFRYNFN